MKIGVLALQGAFDEHVKALLRCNHEWEEHEGCFRNDLIQVLQVRTNADLNSIDGLIIPGGESTSMSIISKASSSHSEYNLLDRIAEKIKDGLPTWGTCAGLILLADRVVDQMSDSTSKTIIGGLPIVVCRNWYGSQICSFVKQIDSHIHTEKEQHAAEGIFIRAPKILQVVDKSVKILATLPFTINDDDTEGQCKTCIINDTNGDQNLDQAVCCISPNSNHIVAIHYGHLMATTFHPELSNDLTWHKYFIKNVVTTRVNKPI